MSAETESVSPTLNLEKCSVVLLDVAGTTTSINFVKDTLFPYVVKQADEYLKTHWEEEAVQEAVKSFKSDKLDLEAAIAAVKELTQENSEVEGLKTIQGLIYKSGYENGDLKAHVFPDVVTSFKAWGKTRKVAIYSTGSVESQQLLFSHTEEGDISSHITKYFDQTVGKKTESESYEKIAKELDVKKEEILFVTDSANEAKAAKAAGLHAMLVNREGNEAIPEEVSKVFPVISSFKDILFENSAKRKSEDETVPVEEQPPAKVPKTEVSEEKPAPADEPKEESMEVDAPAEKEMDTTEEKCKTKLTEEPINIAKTETDSNDKKTEEKADSTGDKIESEEATAENDVPMETTPDSTAVENKEETIDTGKKEEEKVNVVPKEEKKVVETETCKVKKIEKPSEEKTNEVSEKMDSEAVSTEKTSVKVGQVGSVEVNGKNKENDTKVAKVDEITESTETKEAERKAVSVCEKAERSNREEKITEVVGDKVEASPDATNKKAAAEDDANTVTSSEKEESKPVKESPKSEEKENGTVKEDKAAESASADKEITVLAAVKAAKAEEKAMKAEEKATKAEEKATRAEDKATKAEDKATKAEDKATKAEEKATKAEEKATKAEEKVAKVEEKATKAEEKAAKAEEKVESKVEVSESCPEKDETVGKPAEDSKVESTEEKENKSDLANGVESSQSDKAEAVNGNSSEKQNGDCKDNEAESKVEEIKVKKIEDAADSTPPVSVEV